jgi:hypothetical protein
MSAIADISAKACEEPDRRWDAPIRRGGRRNMGVDVSRDT